MIRSVMSSTVSSSMTSSSSSSSSRRMMMMMIRRQQFLTSSSNCRMIAAAAAATGMQQTSSMMRPLDWKFECERQPCHRPKRPANTNNEHDSYPSTPFVSISLNGINNFNTSSLLSSSSSCQQRRSLWTWSSGTSSSLSSAAASPPAGTEATGTTASTDNNSSDFENTMEKLFENSNAVQQTAATSDGDHWFVDQALAQEAWDPKWWNLADQAINSVNFIHDMTGWGYAGSIVATTCLLRMVILPLAIRGQRSASRMAHVQPELAMLKKRYEALGTPSTAETKAFTEQMQALFKRYDVKPLSSIAAPFVSAPIFIGMFFGMKKMPELFPDGMSTGGLWWFTDLTVADPTYILPIACGLSFFATIEAGKDQMIDSNPQYGPMILNAFRAMAVVMVPVITTFPSAMLCYWVPNNFITLVQSVTLRNAWVKQQFGIWDRPKPIPGQAIDAGFQETMNNLVRKVRGEPTTEQEKIKRHNQEIDTRKRVQQVSKAARARRRGGTHTIE